MRLEDTLLFKKLKEVDGESGQLWYGVLSVCHNVSNLLKNILINMPEYTLHDEVHSLNVIENVWRIIPDVTKEKLTGIELALLIYAAYFHDSGMFSSLEERKSIELSKEYTVYKNIWLDARSISAEEEKSYSDLVFSDFIRERHADRSLYYIDQFKENFVYNEVPYVDILKQICVSHTKDIQEVMKYPTKMYICSELVNIQYLSLIFRLADLLDIYPNRTPEIVYKMMKPQNTTSLLEWNKHLCIRGWNIAENAIEIFATCKDFKCEYVLRQFIDYINVEIANCAGCINSISSANTDHYKLNLKGNISTDNIVSEGYIYNQLKFELNSQNIIKLLMGENLYGHSDVALRELLQNSVDAVNFRKALEESKGLEYIPRIKVVFKNDQLIIEDNGIGMDLDIIKNYFLQVGKSYYKSRQAKEKVYSYNSISEFGIGILSVFMVADNITIETRLRPSNLNEAVEPVYLEVPTAFDFFVQKVSDKQEAGTKITLKLKKNHPFREEDFYKLLEEMAPFINLDLEIVTEGAEKVLPAKRNMVDAIHFDLCKKILEVDVTNKFLGIEGVVVLYQMEEKYGDSSSVLAKNGFSIFSTRNIVDWAKVAYAINITNPKVKLNTSRDSLIYSDEFEKIQSAINDCFIDAVYEFLLEKKNNLAESEYLDLLYEYIDLGILFDTSAIRNSGAKLPEKLKSLILIPILEKDGSCSYKPLDHVLMAREVVIPSNVLKKNLEKFEELVPEIFARMKECSKGNIPVLYNIDDRGVLAFRIIRNAAFSVDEYIETCEPGFVLKIAMEAEERIIRSVYKSNFSDNIAFVKRETKDPLFLYLKMPRDTLTTPDMLYNTQHPIIKPFVSEIPQEVPNFAEKCLEDLFWKLRRALMSYNIYYSESQFFSSTETNQEAIKEFLEEVNSVCKELWDKYIEFGLVSQDLKCPEITQEDFPYPF